MTNPTPIRKAYIRGLHLAAMAAAYEARKALAAGNTAEWACRAMHAAQLTEDARIVGGDAEALLDRTERVLFDEHLRQREMQYQLRDMRSTIERTAIEGARMALLDLHLQRELPAPPDWLEPSEYQADRAYFAPASVDGKSG